MKRRIIITAGHNGPGTGAASQWLDEGTETIVLRDLITGFLRSKGYEVFNDPNELPLRGVIAWIRKQFTGADFLLEIHFNSSKFINEATGTECFVSRNATKLAAQMGMMFCDAITGTTGGGISNRGVKDDRMSQHNRLAILEDTPAIAVLLEVCFLNNKNDVQLYRFYKNEIANKIASIIDLAL